MLLAKQLKSSGLTGSQSLFRPTRALICFLPLPTPRSRWNLLLRTRTKHQKLFHWSVWRTSFYISSTAQTSKSLRCSQRSFTLSVYGQSCQRWQKVRFSFLPLYSTCDHYFWGWARYAVYSPSGISCHSHRYGQVSQRLVSQKYPLGGLCCSLWSCWDKSYGETTTVSSRLWLALWRTRGLHCVCSLHVCVFTSERKYTSICCK